jgi:hypothetical protein
MKEESRIQLQCLGNDEHEHKQPFQKVKYLEWLQSFSKLKYNLNVEKCVVYSRMKRGMRGKTRRLTF